MVNDVILLEMALARATEAPAVWRRQEAWARVKASRFEGDTPRVEAPANAEALRPVEQHLHVGGECQDEFSALAAALGRCVSPRA